MARGRLAPAQHWPLSTIHKAVSVQQLWEHQVYLEDGELRLRPLTEDDWDLLLRWNSDPEVLYFSEGDDVQAYTLAEVQSIYRGASQTAFCFIIELAGVPIGEGWVQRMNLERFLRAFPDQDLRRIDLMIGEKEFWGRGLGTRAIALLARLGFRLGADAVCACEVADYNPRSRSAFERNGFGLWSTNEEPEGSKARRTHDLILTKDRWERLTGA